MTVLRSCQRCGTSYHESKSSSSLRLSYCNRLCEVADIGFDMESWLRSPSPTPVQLPLPEPPAPIDSPIEFTELVEAQRSQH